MRCPWEEWPDDVELLPAVRDAQRGVPSAVDALLARLRPTLVTYFGHSLDPDDAEDLAQQALIRIAQALPRIDPARAARYVTRVAQNLLRSEHERRPPDRRWAVAVELADTVESPFPTDGDAELSDRDAARLASLDTLPPTLRTIVDGVLRGLTPSEIGAEQGVHPVTIRTRLSRARTLLRRHLTLEGDGSARAR